jgi:hypothetical protein
MCAVLGISFVVSHYLSEGLVPWRSRRRNTYVYIYIHIYIHIHTYIHTWGLVPSTRRRACCPCLHLVMYAFVNMFILLGGYTRKCAEYTFLWRRRSLGAVP